MNAVRGFTLIELLVAVVILSTGIVAVLRAFEASVAALGEAREALYGTLLTREKLAELESSLKEGSPPSATSSGRFEGDFERYQWEVRASRVAATLTAREPGEDRAALHEVDVSVWRAGGPAGGRNVVTYMRY